MRRWTAEEKAGIVRRFLAGETAPFLATAFGTTAHVVRKFLTHAEARRLRSDGQAYHHAPSREQRNAIVSRYQAGESIVDLAPAFDCGMSTIHRILRAEGIACRSQSESHVRCALRADAFDVAGPERDYWLGFLFADGCVHHGAHAPALKVGLAERDAEHLVNLRAFLGSTHKIRRYEVAARRGGPRYPVADFYVRSAPLVASLERLGMRPKSLERVAPPEVADSRDFWRGVVDGDGSVNAEPAQLRLCGGEQLLRQYAQYLEGHGVAPPRVYKHRTARCWYASAGGDRARQGIRLLYEGASVALDRKVARVQRLL